MSQAKTMVLTLQRRINQCINLGESHFREFKSAFEQEPGGPNRRSARSIAKDIGESLVAFANADGGELLVGVENDGEVTGVPHIRDMLDTMVNAPVTHVHQDTPLQSPTVRQLKLSNIPGSKILYFSVQKSSEFVHLTSDGRCLQRKDKENLPVSCESIQLERQEKRAMEYDRELVTEADASDLDLDVVSRLAERIMPNTSPELFLQYLNLAEYSRQGLKLRRAALLLFGREVAKWHPRCQVRMIRVAGTSMGSGAHYEVEKDETRTAGILELIEGSWDMLRPRLAVTRMGSDSMFSETLLYPETACREALTNAIAHRDYSVQGRGIEIYIFDDRIEIVSPGKLMPTVRLQDLTALKGVHDSRNPYIARTLRESGYMRELGEGIPRIFRAMAEHDLVQPDLSESSDSFKIVLHSKSIFSEGDQAWLRTYSLFDISKDEQKVLLLGRDGKLMAPKEIMDMLKIVDTDEYRQVVESMQSKGLIYNALTTAQVTARRSRHKSRRDVPRYKVRSAPELRQFFDELLAVIAGETPTERVDGRCTQSIRRQLSAGSPYRVNVPWSLRYLGLAGSDGVPLPRMRRLWAAY